MIVGEESWVDIGVKRMWIVGAGGTTLQAKTKYDFQAMRWMYNSENVAYVMKVADRPDSGSPFPNNDSSLGSEHPGGAHVAMADGSVHFLNEEVTLEVLWAMASRASGEASDTP
jgi:prepilin-type processing-associated H-X9-DG protein